MPAARSLAAVVALLVLQQRFPGVRTRRYTKDTFSRPAPASLVEEITSACAHVVAALAQLFARVGRLVAAEEVGLARLGEEVVALRDALRRFSTVPGAEARKADVPARMPLRKSRPAHARMLRPAPTPPRCRAVPLLPWWR